MEAYLEVGRRRTFASALHWPGWSRAGRDEPSALEALLDYEPRYRAALGSLADGLRAPTDASELEVIERLAGRADTDFGVPGVIPAWDEEPPGTNEIERLVSILRACWAAFDGAYEAAAGHELAAAGPRGGGRDLEKMGDHVMAADGAYRRMLGADPLVPGTDWPRLRESLVEALAAKARGKLPEVGPRGGRRWPARYAARRAAWHLLDHAWEIEDRRR